VEAARGASNGRHERNRGRGTVIITSKVVTFLVSRNRPLRSGLEILPPHDWQVENQGNWPRNVWKVGRKLDVSTPLTPVLSHLLCLYFVGAKRSRTSQSLSFSNRREKRKKLNVCHILFVYSDFSELNPVMHMAQRVGAGAAVGMRAMCSALDQRTASALSARIFGQVPMTPFALHFMCICATLHPIRVAGSARPWPPSV
jgi:hypothetical protein